MTEWRQVSLGEVCELKRGYDLPKRSRIEGTVPIVSSSGVTGFHAESKVRAPGVVTGRYGTLGKVYYLTEDFWPLNTALYVRDFKGNHPGFVAALLESMNLGQHDGAAAVPGLNRNQLHGLPVMVPDQTTQLAIAALMRSFDDMIENNRRRVEVLEEMTRTIYQEWFVNFRYPGYEDATFVVSPLGPVPDGWRVKPLQTVARVVRGRSYRRHEIVEEGGLPFINLKCMMRGGGFRRDGLKRYAGEFKKEQLVGSGDIVLAVTDLTQGREILARATLVPRAVEGRGVISLDVVRVVPNELVERLWILSALRWSEFAHRVREYANGSTVLHLSPVHLNEGFILWPPDGLRSRFVEMVAPTLELVDVLQESSDRLASIRDGLLRKLVTGQIDVSSLDLGALVEGVVA